MDLTNKIITIVQMTVNSYPEETTVKVSLSQEISPGVFKVLDTYDLKYDRIFQGTEDAALLAAINETLTGLAV